MFQKSILFLMIFSLTVYAKPKKDPVEEAAVSVIRENYTQNQSRKYVVVENIKSQKKLPEEPYQYVVSYDPPRGGETQELTVYRLNENTLAKIEVPTLHEMGRFFREFHYTLAGNNTLFFVYEKEEKYDEPYGKVISTEENRYYFELQTVGKTPGASLGKLKLIRWIGPKGLPMPKNKAFSQKEKSLQDESDAAITNSQQ